MPTSSIVFPYPQPDVRDMRFKLDRTFGLAVGQLRDGAFEYAEVRVWLCV